MLQADICSSCCFLQNLACKNIYNRPRSRCSGRRIRASSFTAARTRLLRESVRSASLQERRIVGASVPRKEGWDKFTGAARYVDDMVLPGMLYGATVRSNVARGNIRKISFDSALSWSDFVIVTAKDIPGKNCISLILDDQPCLASETVNHHEEPILLLAHADRHKLRKAVDAVSIEYDPLPSVHTIEDSEQQSTIIWGTDNTFKTFLVEKGDVDTVWKDAALIVEREYFTGAQEQLYIENNGVIATYNAAMPVLRS